MAAILQLRRGTSNVTLTEGELYLHQGKGSIQFGSGSSQHTLVKIGSNSGSISFSGDVTASNALFTGNTTVNGNIYLGGDIFLGDGTQATDNINVNATFSGSIVPNTADVFDLGASDKKWNTIYALTGSFSNGIISGSSQLTDDLDLRYLEIGGDNVFSSSVQTDLTQTTNYISGIKSRLNSETVISGSSQVQINSVNGFTSYSSSVDSRLDYIEGTFSSSVDSRLDILESYSSSIETRVLDLESTGSDHETRVLDLESTGSDHENRIDLLESFSSSLDNTFVTEIELNDATASLSASLTITDIDFENRINTLETTFSSSVDLRLDNSELTGSDHESRINNLSSVTGSYATTGSNLFIGNQTITGSIESSGSVSFQGVPWPSIGSESHIIKTQPYSLNLESGSRTYEYAGLALQHFEASPSYYHNSILLYSYDNHDTPNYGTELNVGPLRNHMRLYPSTSFDGLDVSHMANISIEDTQNGTSNALIYADNIQIGAYNSENIAIGNLTTEISIAALNTNINSPITSSNTIQATYFHGDGSNLTNIQAGNVVFGGSGIVSGSSQIDVNDTQNFQTFSSSVDSRLDYLEGDFSTSVDDRLDNVETYTSSLKQAIDVDGSNLIVLGNLTVQGTQTSLNTTQVLIEDLLLTLASGSVDGNEANGAGIEIAGANQSITWDNPNTRWSITSEVSASGFIGDGSGLENVTAADVEFSNILNKPTLVSGSDQVTQSLDSRYLQIEGDSVVSGSSQIDLTQTSNYVSGIKDRLNAENVHSSSYLGTATTSNLTEGINLYYTDLRVKTKLDLEGVISGSSQVNADSITNFDSNVLEYNNLLGVISGSSQVNADTIANFDSNVLDKINAEGVLSGSDQVTQSLDNRYLQIEGDGVVSGSSQIDVNDTQNFQTFSSSVDSRLDYVEGEFSTSLDSRLDLLENFSSSQYNNDSQSFDSRLDFIESYSASLDSRLDSVEGDQHTHSNKANLDEINQNLGTSDSPIFVGLTLSSLPPIPSGSSELNAVFLSSSNELTYRELGTAALYHVTSSDGIALVSGSISYESDNLLTAGAVKKYVDWRTEEIIDAVGAADITSVTTELGLSGGALSGAVTLSLDTASAHFNDGVVANFSSLNSFTSSIDTTIKTKLDIENVHSSSYLGTATTSNLTEGTNLYYTDGRVKSKLDLEGVISGSVQILGGSNVLSSSVTNFTDFSQSVDGRIDLLESFSSSLDNGFVTELELASATGSLINSISTKLDTGSFNSYTSSTNIRLSNIELVTQSQDIRLNNIEGFTSSIDTTIKTKLNTEGVISGSVQILDGSGILSSSATNFTDFSQSVDIRLDQIELVTSSLDSTYEEKASLTHTLVSGSSQVQLIKTDSGSFSTDMVIEGSNLYYTDARVKTKLNVETVVSGAAQIKDLGFVDLTSEQTISGTKTFNDIVVNGTGSFAYITSVAGDAKIIGDSYIILNNDTPTQRYAGIAVYDSGSATPTTASFNFDGQTNDWFYEYSASTVDYGVVLFGPEYNTKGSPTYLTTNRIPKAEGTHHLNDSNISDSGTLITLNSNSQVNGNLVVTGTVSANNLISGSSQVTLSGDITGAANNTQIASGVIVNNDVNASAAISHTKLNFGGSGIVSGSSQVSKTLQEVTSAGNTTSTTISITNSTASTSITTGALVVTGGIGTSGAIFAGGDVVAFATSDRRLKDNIQPIENPLQKINSIGGYSFVWNEEEQHIYKGKDYGVIAQEIEEILPELVDTRENGYKAVKYDKIISLLIEGIKELSSEVQELKNKLNQ